MASPSSYDLSPALADLVRTAQASAEMTIRRDRAGGHTLNDTLPRIKVAPSTDADLEPLDFIGKGGGGIVRLARQRALDREVAVKTVNPEAEGPVTAKLLLQEGLITGRLEHPNIVPVHLMGLDDDERPVIVMKRIEGQPWSEVIGEDMPLERHLEIFLEVCHAVAFAHDRGLVHRDIKPSNVMIGRFGEVYLLDWGISCPVGTGAFEHVAGEGPGMPLGTPLYMAPEMVATQAVIDERTDVYLLGATLHRVLTEEPRHQASELVEVLELAAKSPPATFDDAIPAELGAMINRACARDPADRYPSVEALREAVRAFLRHRTSIEMAREAERSLVALQARLEEEEPTGVRRLATECRFAFMTALGDWPENSRAEKGLQRCLAIMARVEIDAGQLDAAAALISEFPSPDQGLAAELDEARHAEVERRAEVKELRSQERDRDLRVAKKARAKLAIALGVLVVGMMSTVFINSDLIPLTAKAALVVMLPFIGIYAVTVLALRQRLLSTAINRQIVLLLGLGITAMSINRGFAWWVDAPFAYMLALDLFIAGVIAATGALAIDWQLCVPAAIWVLGAAGILALRDSNVFLAYAPSQIGGLVLMAYLWVRRSAAR